MSSKLEWLPKSNSARVYFVIVYGLLFPWFAISFFWGEVVKGWLISPIELQVRVRYLLGLLWLPPLTGMGVDLCMARWTDVPYRSKVQRIGAMVLLIALDFTLLEMVRFYVLKS